MAGISTDATGIATGITSLQSGLETPDVALNLRKSSDSVVRCRRPRCCCCACCALHAAGRLWCWP